MNCSFNIRYKPRTTRAFTKSDLTVYDSAGNTALNALTVYGKSEVVDGAITSAGEGYAVVRLADLTWTSNVTGGFAANLADSPRGIISLICSKYAYDNSVLFFWDNFNNYDNKTLYRSSGQSIYIKDTDYTTESNFIASLGDATLAYQLADSTQGNCIAVKTDDGTGINGTMAVFETGTPLRGIPETDVRDVMTWDGSSGVVTKNCNKVRLADLMWTYWSAKNCFTTSLLSQKTITAFQLSPYLCVKYTATIPYIYGLWQDSPNKSIFQSISESFVVIHDTDYTTVEDFVASLGDAELVYELATPTTQNLTTAENNSIAALRTFTPQTHAQNNAGAEMTVDYTIRVPTI